MQGNDYFLNFLPFWVVMYGLAVVAWTCLGRFILAIFVKDSSKNYILRWFERLTDWPIDLIALITPRAVAPGLLPLVTAVWFFLFRFVAYLAFANLEMIPRMVSP
ncbi:MAG: hypothetical protein OEL53_17835 [Rhodospirillales bacterium]|nr:hypothetical protein [Rhodospirillales bacterium]